MDDKIIQFEINRYKPLITKLINYNFKIPIKIVHYCVFKLSYSFFTETQEFINVTKKKKDISNKTSKKMKKLLELEYNFYYFVKKRFTKQYNLLFDK